MLEIELFICINGFSINDIKWLMCHKTKPHQTTDLFDIVSGFLEGYILVRGARDLMDIVVRNGFGDPRSNSGRGCLHVTQR